MTDEIRADALPDPLRDELLATVSAATQLPAALLAARRLAGGASMESWSVDLRVGDVTEGLVLRRDMGANMSAYALDRATEFALLQTACAAGVRAPQPRYLSAPGAPRAWFLMDRLPGESVGRKVVRAPDLAAAREKLARQLGEALAVIHRVPVEPEGLGCAAIGYTIYPGSSARNSQYADFAAITAEAKSKGLATVLWAYPRGEGVSKDGETAIDVVAYAAQISAQLGAHIIKVKPPKDFIEQSEAKKVFEKYGIPTATLTDRIRHVVQSSFNGKRIVIFSGGEAKDSAALLGEIKEIAAGGGFGSIMGRNAFQRSRPEALKLLGDVMAVFKNAG